MGNTKYYTDVFGRTTELDFDDIIRKEEQMSTISAQAEFEQLIYKYYSSDDDE